MVCVSVCVRARVCVRECVCVYVERTTNSCYHLQNGCLQKSSDCVCLLRSEL